LQKPFAAYCLTLKSRGAVFKAIPAQRNWIKSIFTERYGKPSHRHGSETSGFENLKIHAKSKKKK
jgi:hypothetical protein